MDRTTGRKRWSFRVACQVDFERETGSRATFEVLGGTRIAKRRRPREARRRECGLPFAVGAEQGVGERDQLAHDGG